MNTHNSVVAANYMRAYGYDKGINLNVTQVQKLLYLAYGIGLVKYNLAIVDESPKAWPYGPVFPKTRKRFHEAPKLTDENLTNIKEDEDAVKILKYVVDNFGTISASKLSAWSHSEGGPWDLVVKENGTGSDEPIKDDYIKEFFSKYNFELN